MRTWGQDWKSRILYFSLFFWPVVLFFPKISSMLKALEKWQGILRNNFLDWIKIKENTEGKPSSHSLKLKSFLTDKPALSCRLYVLFWGKKNLKEKVSIVLLLVTDGFSSISGFLCLEITTEMNKSPMLEVFLQALFHNLRSQFF